MSVELEEYSGLFSSHNIDGNELLTMDSARIKVRVLSAVLVHLDKFQPRIFYPCFVSDKGYAKKLVNFPHYAHKSGSQVRVEFRSIDAAVKF